MIPTHSQVRPPNYDLNLVGRFLPLFLTVTLLRVNCPFVGRNSSLSGFKTTGAGTCPAAVIPEAEALSITAFRLFTR